MESQITHRQRLDKGRLAGRALSFQPATTEKAVPKKKQVVQAREVLQADAADDIAEVMQTQPEPEPQPEPQAQPEADTQEAADVQETGDEERDEERRFRDECLRYANYLADLSSAERMPALARLEREDPQVYDQVSQQLEEILDDGASHE